MTPSMQLSDIIRSYADHPDKERITRDLNRAMTLGHQFGIDRAADALKGVGGAVEAGVRSLKVTEVQPVRTLDSDFT